MRTDKLERAPGTGRHNNYSISGLLVMAKPESCADLQQRFSCMDGVEIADVTGSKIIVTVEELPGERRMIDRITEIQNTPGVVCTTLVYSHQIDESTTQLEGQP